MSIKTTYTEARAKLADLMNRATADRETVVITRRRGGSIVLVAESEWNSILETSYLLRSPANAERLLRAVDRARRREIEPSSIDSLMEEVGIERAEVEACAEREFGRAARTTGDLCPRVS